MSVDAPEETAEETPEATGYDEETEALLSQVKDVSAEIREKSTEYRRQRERLVKQLVDRAVKPGDIRKATGLSWAAFDRVRKAAVGA